MMRWAVIKREMMEEIGLIGGLIGMQVMFAGNSVLMSYFMKLGIEPLAVVSCTALFTFLLLMPLSIILERRKWPDRLSLKLSIQFLMISFTGVTLFQTLFLKGVERTSPAIATAMPNLAPGFIFIIAWILGLEKVKLSCTYSRVKLLGTFLCVLGALLMSIMHSTKQKHAHQSSSESAPQPQPDSIFDMDQIIGCLYLLAAVVTLSSNIVLQATTLSEFPAPISLVAIISFIGVFLTLIVQLIQDHKFQIGRPDVSIRDLLTFSLLGGIVSGSCTSFNGWAMSRKGPVFVSMFSPISTVLSVAISIVSLGDTISFGSLAGMSLMFSGLYFVLWAKGKEGPAVDAELLHDDPEKPLLS
ncbi:unnamed protein product [Rhodiola kirilowii]